MIAGSLGYLRSFIKFRISEHHHNHCLEMHRRLDPTEPYRSHFHFSLSFELSDNLNHYKQFFRTFMRNIPIGDEGFNDVNQFGYAIEYFKTHAQVPELHFPNGAHAYNQFYLHGDVRHCPRGPSQLVDINNLPIKLRGIDHLRDV